MANEPLQSDPSAALVDERRRRQHAEDSLHELEEHHRLLIENARDYAIILLDRDGRITSWNEGARRLTGYAAEEVLSRPGDLLFTAEDRAAGLPERELTTAWATGSFEDENWMVRSDGSRFWASGVSTAVHAESATPPGFVKVLRDLTERREAQAALESSEERLRAALTAARMGTWFWDIPADRQEVDDNLALLLGLGPEPAAGTLDEFLTLIHPGDQPATAAGFARSARDGASLNVEFRVVQPDGTVRWLRDQGDVVRDADGRIWSLTGACVDITERKELEDELRRARDELERRVEERTAELRESQRRALQAERLAAIGLTIAGMAHESGNALQVIRACSERLGWRLEGQPEALALIAEILKAQADLERLFGDVRAFAGPLGLECRPLDLAEVWREAWAQALAQHPGRHIPLEEELAGVDLVLLADAFRLGPVFRNLFDNALAACPDPVRVRVSCAPAELDGCRAVRVAVRDSGPGLDAEQQQQLFEPFYTTKTKGTGLGLSIARRIVEAHGGRIDVGQANAPGTEIVLVLPRREA
jgi:PAS domain S-box-containing protein